MPAKVDLLNISINSISRKQLLNQFKEGVIFTPNVDHLVKLQKDKEFYMAYQQADYVICDSRIVGGISKFLGTPIKEVIPGSDFLGEFCNFHRSNRDVKVFLLGAAEGVAAEAMEKINSRIGREIVVGAHSPSFGFERKNDECESIIEMINRSEASVLVVGVGAPKQEKWIAKYKGRFEKVKIFMALGATLDFEAGNIKRAPKFMQKLALEWLYRLAKEPGRLWRRYLIEGAPFFVFVLKQKLRLYKNPF